MTKKRASLAGRGVEILFGGGPDEPSGATSESDEWVDARAAARGDEDRPNVDAEEAMAAEWEAMLEREAASATSGTHPSDYTADSGRSEWPTSSAAGSTQAKSMWSEAESPPAAGAKGSDQAPAARRTADAQGLPLLATTPAQAAKVEEADAGLETPPAPGYADSLDAPEDATVSLRPVEGKAGGSGRLRLAEGALYETSTAEVPDDGLVPDDGFEAPTFTPETPAEYEANQPSRIREEQEVLDYVGLKQRQALWDEINGLYEVVPEVLSTDEQQEDALRLLQEAQDILMERPRQFDVAKYKAGQVKSIILRRRNITKWTNTYGWGAFLYESIWVVLLLLAVFGSSSVVNWIEEASGALVNVSPAVLSALWTTMAWGGLGGVVGAYYSLYWHAAKLKDFDKQYIMWYIVQPVLGLLIGALVHLIVGSGLLTGADSASESPLIASLFPAAVAFIASFRQRFILEMIDRIIQLITPSPK